MIDSCKFFEETIYHPKKEKLSLKGDQIYSPWSEVIQDYRGTPIYKPKPQRHSSTRRYTSQLDSHVKKNQSKIKSPRQKPYLLSQKSVTIEYEGQYGSKQYNKIGEKQNKIKLPVLCIKSSSNETYKQNLNTPEDKWSFLSPNQRKSLKKYVKNNTYEQNPPHFQIYKRSLIAARKYVLNNIGNPQAC